MFVPVKKFIADESGATVIEYSLIATFIGIAIIGSMQALGVSVVATFAFVNAAL